MNQTTEFCRCMILRLKIFQSVLTRNVAKFGSMSPYIEIVWNNERWKTKVSAGHLNPVWNEGYAFEALDPGPLEIQVRHSSLFMSQEIGSITLSVDDITHGKIKEWVEIYHETACVGKIQLSVNMYEERRSQQSNYNTSYGSIDLKDEYSRKLNELELEKEELEFYKRKYKRKVEKLNQEKRNYRAKVSEIVRRATPKHTEESSSEEICDINQPNLVLIAPSDDLAQEEAILKKEKALLHQEKEALAHLKDQIEVDLARLRREKQKVSLHRKVLGHSQGKLSDITKHMDTTSHISKSTSEEKIIGMSSKIIGDWQEIEDIKDYLIRQKGEENNEELLELKMNVASSLTSPRRAITPKSTDLGRSNGKFRCSNYSTEKLVVYD
jgi:C2 domain